MAAFLIVLIRLYQLILRGLWTPSCRFFPSCSEYAIESLSFYGFWRGSALLLRRLSRCHPWGRGSDKWGERWGIDPVPSRQREEIA